MCKQLAVDLKQVLIKRCLKIPFRYYSNSEVSTIVKETKWAVNKELREKYDLRLVKKEQEVDVMMVEECNMQKLSNSNARYYQASLISHLKL